MPGQERQPVTKLTAMLGGCDWKDTFNAPIGQLDPQVAYEKTLEVMSKFLQMDAEPIAHMIHLQQKCIPQYVVGHDARMRELHQAISNTYGHKMSVTGASYMGVSVPDCIKNSRLLVEDLMVSGALGSQQKVVTGLDKVNDLNDSHRISKGNTDVILNTK
jgi:oxygen-dependent protoporphyrinogen oxidase